jgi:hypothetical protein
VFTSQKHGHVSPEEQAFNDADCVRVLLERDWILEDPHNDKGLKFVTKFLSYHLSKDSANLILSSFEGTTLKAYKAGWSVFIDFLLSCEWDDIDFFNSEEQVQELYDNFVASFLNSAYNIHVAENVSQKLIVRGFKKTNRKVLLNEQFGMRQCYLTSIVPTLFYKDDKAHYRFLQTKAIALIMFFCLTRMQETA